MPSLRAVAKSFILVACFSRNVAGGPTQDQQVEFKAQDSGDDFKASKEANRDSLIRSIAHYDAKRQESNNASPLSTQASSSTPSGVTSVPPNSPTSPPTTTVITSTTTLPISTSPTSTSPATSSTPTTSNIPTSSVPSSTQPISTSSPPTSSAPPASSNPPSSTFVQPSSPSSASLVPASSAPSSVASSQAASSPAASSVAAPSASSPQTSFNVAPSTGFVPQPIVTSSNGQPVTRVSSVPVASVTEGPIVSGTAVDVDTTDQFGAVITLTGASPGKVYTITDAQGHVITTTYSPGGDPVRSIQVLTSTLPNGQPSTLTSIAVIVPTVVNSDVANQPAHSSSRTAAADASLVTGNAGVQSVRTAPELLALVAGAGAVAAFL